MVIYILFVEILSLGASGINWSTWSFIILVAHIINAVGVWKLLPWAWFFSLALIGYEIIIRGYPIYGIISVPGYDFAFADFWPIIVPILWFRYFFNIAIQQLFSIKTPTDLPQSEIPIEPPFDSE